jgi:broad specificity phosphatase PhoE
VTTFYLIRHGQTEWNREKRIQGQIDVQLSDRGRQQALLAGEALQGEGITYLYASDLSRALETANIISRIIGVPVFGTYPALREIDFGHWSSMTFDEIAANDPEALQRWRQDRVNTVVPGGESFKIMTDRVLRCMQELGNRHPNAKVAVVTHGGPIVYTLGTLLGFGEKELLKLSIGNCSISTIAYNAAQGQWRVIQINETGHLWQKGCAVEGVSY